MPIHVEDWAPDYGSPYQVGNPEAGAPDVRLKEDGDSLKFHRGEGEPVEKIAFIDGVRRIEARLYYTEGEVFARGLAGVFACGSVVWTPAECVFGERRVERVVIWGSGISHPLPDIDGGWTWKPLSVASTEPDQPEVHLQQQMLQSEVDLAGQICREGHLTIRDGPLTFYHATAALPIVGYVKTHQRALLPAEAHAKIPGLQKGERTSIFTLGDRYACYTRLAEPSASAGPWSGIVRLEIPQAAGEEAAVKLLGRVAAAIVPFAGVPHRDPRAPQNLQPVSALESHLRRLFGSPKLATRAVRESIRLLSLASEKIA